MKKKLFVNINFYDKKFNQISTGFFFGEINLKKKGKRIPPFGALK